LLDGAFVPILDAMKTTISCVVMLVLFDFAGAEALAQGRAAARGDPQEAGQNGWLFSLDEAKAEARKTGLPILVVIRCVP
jgi:hypothetical protein